MHTIELYYQKGLFSVFWVQFSLFYVYNETGTDFNKYKISEIVLFNILIIFAVFRPICIKIYWEYIVTVQYTIRITIT